MVSDILYKSLIEIGLEDYLKARGGGKIIQERWTVNLDFLVSKFTKEQKEILKNKINEKKNETHAQHNDIFHEISIACAFYSNVNFLSESKDTLTPDFRFGSTNVEVKSINNSNEEKNRLSELDKGPRCEHKPIRNDENFINSSVQAITKKFKEHIEKAKKQLGADGGDIWVVYAHDSPPGFSQDERLKLEVENKLDEIIKTLSTEYKVRYIHFGKLRDELESKITEVA